ncbi:MAG: hypothetical protein ACK4N5_25075 [Myxococcales bacterium]
MRLLCVAQSLDAARVAARAQRLSDESVSRLLTVTSANATFFPLLRTLLDGPDAAIEPGRLPQLVREVGLLISGALELHVEGVMLAALGWILALAAEGIEQRQPVCARPAD